MKLRDGWKAHTGFWRYKESPLGFAVESVVKFKRNGVVKYEARFRNLGCCGYANTISDFWGTKIFADREEAFLFCEEMYQKRMQAKAETVSFS